MSINEYTVDKLKQDIKNIFNEFKYKTNTLKKCNKENKYILESCINKYLNYQYINKNCAEKLHCKVSYLEYNPSNVLVDFYNSNNELIYTDKELESCITSKPYVKYKIDLNNDNEISNLDEYKCYIGNIKNKCIKYGLSESEAKYIVNHLTNNIRKFKGYNFYNFRLIVNNEGLDDYIKSCNYGSNGVFDTKVTTKQGNIVRYGFNYD